VRVEKPLDLADLILSKASDVTPEQFRQILAGGEEKHLKLDRGIPVYLAYLTASVDDEGGVRFYPDLYDRDSDVTDVARARLSPAPVSVQRPIAS
jgi:murein L,D-transpeptidase YcbB/YkuD